MSQNGIDRAVGGQPAFSQQMLYLIKVINVVFSN